MDEKGYFYYDSHAHLISADEDRYPRNPMPPPANSPFGPGMVGRPGGQHGPTPFNAKPDAEQMLQWMVEEGVRGIAAVQKGMIYRLDNSYIVDSAERWPDLMSAVIIVDPQASNASEIVQELAKRGIVGVRFFGLEVKDKESWLTSPQAIRVWDTVADLGLVIDIEPPAIDSARLISVVAGLADRYPDTPVVLDHLFMPDLKGPQFGMGESYGELAARENIFVKFTSLNMDVARETGKSPAQLLRHATDILGAEHVMWGSDIGTSSGTYHDMVRRALDAAELLSEEERRSVMHDTGHRIFAVRKVH